MEKAINKLKFEIGVLKGLHSSNVEINERIASYEKAVEFLEGKTQQRLVKEFFQVKFKRRGHSEHCAYFPIGTTDEEIVEHFEDLYSERVQWKIVK